MLRLAIVIWMLASPSLASTSNLVIDSFSPGGFERTTSGITRFIPELPIALPRTIGITRLATQANAYIESSPSRGLDYYGKGLARDGKNLSMSLQYKTETIYTIPEDPVFAIERTETEYSLYSYSAFTFDFAEVSGEGMLSIDMGFGTVNVSVTEAGIITIPFSEWIIAPDSARSFNNITYLNIKWQNITEEAGFTLREIAAIQPAIPEPAAYATLCGLATLLPSCMRRYGKGAIHTPACNRVIR